MTSSIPRPSALALLCAPLFLLGSVHLTQGCATALQTSVAVTATSEAAPTCPAEGSWEVVSSELKFKRVWRAVDGSMWALGFKGEEQGLFRQAGETWTTVLDMSRNQVGRDMDPHVLLGGGAGVLLAERKASPSTRERRVPPQLSTVADDRCDLGVWAFDGETWSAVGDLELPAAGPDERVATLAIMYPFGNPLARGFDKAALDETALAAQLAAGSKVIAAHNAEAKIQREEEAMLARERAEMGESEEELHDPMARFAIDQGEEIDPLEELLSQAPFSALGSRSFDSDVGVWRGDWGEEFDAALFVAEPGDLVGPFQVGKRVIVARLEENTARRPRPGACPNLYWHGGWRAPSGVSYLAGTAAHPSQYPLGRVARVDGDELRFMPGSCARTRLGSASPDTQRWVCSPLYDVWGTAEDDLVAVGNVGHIVGFNGESWSPVEAEGWHPPSHDLNAIWGAGDGALVAVGRKGSIVQGKRGGGLALAESPVVADLAEVWGRSAEDVFAVGQGGTIVHFDGRAWRQEASGTELDLQTVWGVGDCDVMASSTFGVLLRRRSGGKGEPAADVAVPLVTPAKAP
jgi:hypothetical protein